jgi:hypothetical protein
MASRCVWGLLAASCVSSAVLVGLAHRAPSASQNSGYGLLYLWNIINTVVVGVCLFVMMCCCCKSDAAGDAGFLLCGYAIFAAWGVFELYLVPQNTDNALGLTPLPVGLAVAALGLALWLLRRRHRAEAEPSVSSSSPPEMDQP